MGGEDDQDGCDGWMFYADIVENNSNNQLVLFSSNGKMLNLHATKKLPSYDVILLSL